MHLYPPSFSQLFLLTYGVMTWAWCHHQMYSEWLEQTGPALHCLKCNSRQGQHKHAISVSSDYHPSRAHNCHAQRNLVSFSVPPLYSQIISSEPLIEHLIYSQLKFVSKCVWSRQRNHHVEMSLFSLEASAYKSVIRDSWDVFCSFPLNSANTNV